MGAGVARGAMRSQHTSAETPLSDMLFEEAGVGLCLVAPDGTVVRANAEWLRSTGLELDDVLGARVVDLFPATRDLALALHARARAGQRVELSRRAQHIGGRETWWEGSISPVPMDGGTGLLVTARDVTTAVIGSAATDGRSDPDTVRHRAQARRRTRCGGGGERARAVLKNMRDHPWCWRRYAAQPGRSSTGAASTRTTRSWSCSTPPASA